MRELVKLAVERSKEAIVIITNHLDKAGEPSVAYANEEFLNITDYDLDDIIGKNPSFFFSTEHDDNLVDEIKSSISKHRTWKGPVIIYDKQKEHHIIYFTIIPIYNFVNEIMYYACFGRKVEQAQEPHHNTTSCKHLDNFINTIFASTNYFREISDQLPTGLWRIDENLNVVFANNVAQEQFGILPDKSLLTNILNTEHRNVKSIFNNINLNNKINAISFRIKHNDNIIWASCEFWPIFEEDNVVGFAGTVQDVTSEQLLIKQLQVLGRK